jgi:hypothetical protein
MIKVRFHLGRGKNYKHWRIEYKDKTVEFYNPDIYSLKLYNIKLKNNRKVSDRIYSGENKSVCSYIICEKIDILNKPFEYNEDLIELKYNPRIIPYWNIDGVNMDGKTFDKCITIQNKVFI